MFELKRLSPDGVERALEKVERYRLLNEPWQAESICRDVLTVDPANQHALTALVLAISDQFRTEGGASRAPEATALLAQIADEYARCYYAGIICERRGTAQIARHAIGGGEIAYDWLRRAMEWYEKAERMRPTGNYDALLRWNTCVRVIERHPDVRPGEPDNTPLPLE
ncbi:hypothetical protein BH23GEM10_BH23GEM10_13970 [soil metagenome]